jgi:pyrroline-5-carboxylate reductase
MKVLVLGAGKMTEALLTGLRKTEDLSEWHIFTPSGQSAERLAAMLGAKHLKDLDSLPDPDWILVGCKPQQLEALKASIGERFSGHLFVSMLAALTESQQLQVLAAQRLIRIMPNLPVALNAGVTLLASSSAATELERFRTLFQNLGTSLAVSEAELEELTLLTGSGPAFFYEMALRLAEGFKSLTLEERQKLARQVLAGAGASCLAGEKPLIEMISAVTSKGGVTIAVLEEWRKGHFAQSLGAGISAGKQRTEELKALLHRK